LLILGWDYYARRNAYLERALELYRRVDAPEAMTRVHIELASVYSNANTMNLQRSMSHFQAAEALLSQHPCEKLRMHLYGNLADAYAWSARTADGLEASRRAMSIDAALAPEDRLGVPTTSGWHLASDGQLAGGLAALERACEAGSRVGGIASFTANAFRS